MKKLMVIMMVMLTVVAFAGVEVTYVANTSTVAGQGITDSTHQVQICGSEVGPEGEDIWSNIFLTWDDFSPMMTNVGGDYWELTIEYPDSMIGWRMAYKVRYKANDDDEFTWETTTGGGNRMWALPDADTTLMVAYADNDYNPPFTPSDSVDIFFRVNMSADDAFDDTKPLCIVGGFPIEGSGTNMWSPGTYVLEEQTAGFWTYHMKLDPSLLPLNDVMFRFHNGSDWSDHSENLNGAYVAGNENRTVSVGANDTTLAWVWWNDIVGGVFEGSDTADITIGVDMSKAVQTNGFEIGDTLEVRLGYENSSATLIEQEMTHVGGTQSYSVQIDDVPLTLDEYLYYQYYLIKDGEEQREVYYNFNYDGDTPNGAERRRIIVDSTEYTIADVAANDSEERRMPFFRNNSPLAQDVTVHVECDLRPAIATVAAGETLNDIQGSINITPSDLGDILTTGVAINGPMSNNGEGTWAGWGSSLMNDTTRAMVDDGTNGDATANDSIFTITYMFSPDSGHTVGQECKFGIGGGDNEGGEGGYGNNHIVNIDDSQVESYLYIPFGSINPSFYNDWTAKPGVGIDDVLPVEFALEQNYPNPFNPVTTISYSIPADAQVTMNVYDMTGRKISELVNSYAAAGSYEVVFDGTNMASGVYFYEVTAGDFRSVKKMVLVK